jgi:putative redox protein
MQIKVQHLGGVKFEATTRGHRVVCDQPASNGGSDSGMTPPEFLLASLGTCSGYYAAQYLKNHSLSTDGLEIVVSAEKLKSPFRLGDFHIEVIAPHLDPANEAGIRRAVEACLIHNTLLHTPAIDIAVHNAPVTA